MDGNGNGTGTRAGTLTLTLLGTPIAAEVLEQLSEGPKRLAELRRSHDSAPQTTLRARLKSLEDLGVIVKRSREESPGVVEYALTESGGHLLEVAAVLGRWLARKPGEPLSFGSNGAKRSVKALTDAWSSTMLRYLAHRSLSLTELAAEVRPISYPAVERRLAAMRLAGMVEARPSEGNGTPYAVTDWLRQSVAPLAAAVRWERDHLAEGPEPLAGLDAEGVFLLALPLLRTPRELSGSCLMGMDLTENGRGNGNGKANGNGNGAGRNGNLAGAIAYVEQGRVSSCTPSLDDSADAWATAAPPHWAEAMSRGETDGIEIGGDRPLAGALLEGLPKALVTADPKKG